MRELVNQIDDKKGKINELRMLRGLEPMFDEGHEGSKRRRILATPCATESDFAQFCSILYIVVYEETKGGNPNKPITKMQLGHFRNHPFTLHIAQLRHSFNHGQDKIYNKKITPADVYEKYLSKQNLPSTSSEFQEVQSGLLKDFIVLLDDIYEALKKDSFVEDDINEALDNNIEGDMSIPLKGISPNEPPQASFVASPSAQNGDRCVVEIDESKHTHVGNIFIGKKKGCKEGDVVVLDKIIKHNINTIPMQYPYMAIEISKQDSRPTTSLNVNMNKECEVESRKEQLRKEVVEIQEWKTLLDSVNARCSEVANSEIQKIASELDMTDCLPILDYGRWVNDFDTTLEEQGIEELKDFISLMRIDCAQRTAYYLSDICDSIKMAQIQPAVSQEELEFFMSFMPIRYKELYCALDLLDEKAVNKVLSLESSKVYNLLYDAYKSRNPKLFEDICIAENVSIACRLIYREILCLPGIMERVDSEIEKKHITIDKAPVLLNASPDTELNRFADPLMDLLEGHEYNPVCDEIVNNTKLLGFMKGLCLSFVHDGDLPKGMNIRLKREWRKFERFFERYDTAEANELVDEAYQDSIAEDKILIAQEVVQDYIETAHSNFRESQGLAPVHETDNSKPFDLDPNTNLDATIKLNDRFSQFPTRLIAVKGVYAQSYNDILKAIFEKFNFFENMSPEDFVYLFGGLSSRPSSYNPPFYWNTDEGILKAIIRILYVRQPRNLNKLILRVADKGTGCSSHKWSTNKNKVAYFDIETQIIDIVKQVCGADLPRL